MINLTQNHSLPQWMDHPIIRLWQRATMKVSGRPGKSTLGSVQLHENSLITRNDAGEILHLLNIFDKLLNILKERRNVYIYGSVQVIYSRKIRNGI